MQANAGNPLFASSLHQIQSSLYDGKRKYLSDLPPPQIIEICLLFELHVPLYVKNWVWPENLRNVILGVPLVLPSTGGAPENGDKVKVMDALVEDASKNNADRDESGDKDKEIASKDANAGTQDPKPPEVTTGDASNPAPAADRTSPNPSAPSTPAVVTAPTGVPIPTPTPNPIAAPIAMMHAGYPHQPYGYQSYPPPPSYYPHLWGHYPHMPYALPHPHPHPHLHPHPTATATTTTAYQPAITPYTPPTFSTTASSIQDTESISSIPPHPRDDDMPSYEDMIVEALTGSHDPDGVAPKDIYAWMQTHYPVQSNFRPSASQALQKAYKKGRFEKGNNGKYRVNPNYSGVGSSSITRKPTRRPQTVVNQLPPKGATAPTRSSPFTHAPLNRTAFPGLSHFPTAMQPTFAQSSVPDPGSDNTQDGDAYQAAQHILKTINFREGLLSLTSSEQEQKTAEQVAEKEWEDGVRAQLQAQLALLAAQLDEYAQEHEAGMQAELASATAPVIEVPLVVLACPIPQAASATAMAEEDEDEDDDMDEVIIP